MISTLGSYPPVYQLPDFGRYVDDVQSHKTNLSLYTTFHIGQNLSLVAIASIRTLQCHSSQITSVEECFAHFLGPIYWNKWGTSLSVGNLGILKARQPNSLISSLCMFDYNLKVGPSVRKFVSHLNVTKRCIGGYSLKSKSS